MKKTLTTITLAAVMAFGSTFTFANGGIMISDLTSGNTCTNKTGILISERTGIMISDFVGILISELGGILISEAKGCSANTQNTGIMISD